MKSQRKKEKRPLASKALSNKPTEASQDETSKSTSIVDDLRGLLGDDVILLPIPRGSKKPIRKGWQNTTLSRMEDPEYLAELNHGENIGVLLGNGWVTIDLDRDQDVEAFLVLNPKLRETLCTRRIRGCNFWLRIKGDCRPSCKLKTMTGEDWGEWRAEGNQTVIHGEAIDKTKGETQPTPYKILNRAKPLELAFDEIHWPDELVLRWASAHLSSTGAKSLDDLRRIYGEPIYFDEKGLPCSLNQSFWAGLFASENILLS